MKSRTDIAAQKKESGAYNCAQAVACTYADLTGLDEATIKNIGCGFGAGMGCMEGTCGAITGACVVLGLVTKDKAKAMGGMRHIINRFQERNGSIQCKALKGVETGKVLRDCTHCVTDAAEFLEEVLADEE